MDYVGRELIRGGEDDGEAYWCQLWLQVVFR
jgi:hypothetical protein